MSKITTASINGNGEIFSRLAFVNELWIMHPRACTNTCMWIITRQTLTRSRTSRHADVRTSRRNNLGTGGWWRGREGLCGCSDGIRVTWSSLWMAWFVPRQVVFDPSSGKSRGIRYFSDVTIREGGLPGRIISSYHWLRMAISGTERERTNSFFITPFCLIHLLKTKFFAKICDIIPFLPVTMNNPIKTFNKIANFF